MSYFTQFCLTVFVLFSLISCAPQRPPYAEEWPVYQANQGHQGYVPAGPEPPLKEKWTFETKGRIVEAPVLAGGQLALTSRDGWVYLVDPETGQMLWKEEIGQGGLGSSPVFYGEHLLGGTWTPYYFVYAWERAGGKRIWERQTGEILNRAPFVLAAQETVYFNADPPLSAPADVLSVMTALSLPDFKPLWERPLKGAVQTMPTLALEHDLLFIALSEPPSLQALDRKTGELRWSFELDSKPMTTPLWGEGRVYVGTEAGYLYSLIPMTGKIDWRFQIPNDRIRKDLALAEHQLLITGEKYLYAFDTRELALQWRFRSTQALTAPVATQKHVYVGSENKLVYILDRLTGNVQGYAVTKGEILGSPMIVGPYLFVGTSDGKLYAFEEGPRPVYVQPPRR
ncbi:hypothetical protein COW36_00865 [bacterium (Candidatus Blackallbacteria) CG17_big_fil_post_rev_8_21_14_2_50_48_46]|uniref:Pyrrolo-quinoline quinone repeat domain-containing protein n=1 Tax=bacterium (Candidatus Blackallbacteria) CG17_big_fil_post_rev_8_21_14_2_50_48_46 TaxID=2014261 RepID=A0A2M7GBA8_9BACT|nr:MAG: hypothetical protein COW64_10310 [bacterium (Candidatus Blackallbacteria) CG18_big_fil_WC_8_21_14_2_50_49_26]PIW19420.1 MAG: hypothetical protein COW36_00865 [bacterium (Candidatus Blackallbacteria) CG17_big_fil_post_rev_8_21_14_2_50_48_46]PIW48976.1 MAG: hypothetical protein COW20_07590 [bacterium (Candidatus Blackallbacteria) CG13_big_fil_rev_8_21_14_2_50_49_14]